MRRLLNYTEASAALAGLLMLLATCGAAAAQEFAGREKLRAHSAEFRREVIKVASGVWVAVGFSDANSVLIQGEGGSIRAELLPVRCPVPTARPTGAPRRTRTSHRDSMRQAGVPCRRERRILGVGYTKRIYV